jgi:glutathione peroxidase
MNMKRALMLTGFLLLPVSVACSGTGDTGAPQGEMMTQKTETAPTDTMDMRETPFATITGDTINLSAFGDQVMLIVNVASKCGYTKQYSDLEELYRKHKDRGLVVVGFPANNFGGQEPGSNAEILEFCQTRFDVTFPMMAKVSVKGDDQHPLFAQLTEQPDMSGEIKWNFSKFLLDRDGRLVARFDSGVKPTSDELVKQIEGLL